MPLAAAASLLLAAACSDDPAEPIPGGGDPENISRVTVTLTPAGGGSAITSEIVDPDGTTLPNPPGAASAPLALHKGVTYHGMIELLNDIDPSNVIDITAEVEEEANFHRFFYAPSCTGVTVPESSLDLDTQTPTAYPVGLHFDVVVDGAAATQASCTFNIELHHFEADKGDGTGAVFDTDLDIDFPASVSP
jgi:hypothetical protein